ncbi:hypothetical protein [Actinocrispum wychmicini]|uniref:Metallo-beta-lactamase superfamily protein n=1 Tax=Actinocrispum wychmicini TaxID=1213861 RepID=A0A4R2IQZ6_9PSEU|nr:hypothetical protein [Actinocrispum wychmicini]TCO47377.1 hypothetical protein EV192_117117 [Actinocrispum wychmicini]
MTVSRSSPADTRPWHGPPRPSVRRVAELPIWTIRPPTARTLNCVLITGPDGAALVNTGTTARHGAAVAQCVADLTDKPLNTIIYPHHPSTDCRGSTGVTDPDDARSGKVVVLAAGPSTGRTPRGVSPNLWVDRECLLRLSGVTMRLFPVSTGEVGGLNIYLPRHRVAIIADEPCLWKHPPGRHSAVTPFTRAVNWFLRFPVEHLLGSHLLRLSGPEVHLVLRTYLNRR